MNDKKWKVLYCIFLIRNRLKGRRGNNLVDCSVWERCLHFPRGKHIYLSLISASLPFAVYKATENCFLDTHRTVFQRLLLCVLILSFQRRRPPGVDSSTVLRHNRIDSVLIFVFLFLNLTWQCHVPSHVVSACGCGDLFFFAILITTRRSAEQYVLPSFIYYCVAHKSAAIESRLNLALNCTVKWVFFSLFSAIDIDCYLLRLRTRASYRSCLAWIYFFNSSGWL